MKAMWMLLPVLLCFVGCSPQRSTGGSQVDDVALEVSVETYVPPGDIHVPQCEDKLCGFAGDDFCGDCEGLGADQGPWSSDYSYCSEETSDCVVPEPDCFGRWCFVGGGTFVMGSYWCIVEHLGMNTVKEIQTRPVGVPGSFIIGQFEITNEDWEAVMGTDAGDRMFAGCGAGCPATGMTLFGAMEFANRMSVEEGLAECYVLKNCGMERSVPGLFSCDSSRFIGKQDCNGYRLPSEAEWELAAGGGALCPYWTGLSMKSSENQCTALVGIGDAAWFCGNSGTDYDGCEVPTNCHGPRPVGLRKPGPLGLYDMNGNLSEYIGELYLVPSEAPQIDEYEEVIIGSDDVVVTKGGDYATSQWGVLAMNRRKWPLIDENTWRQQVAGFRLVRTTTREEWESFKATGPPVEDPPKPADGTWTDPVTGLTWQMLYDGYTATLTWAKAVKYCQELSLDGGGWRLPDIGELRSLIRGCPTTEIGSETCDVGPDGCMSSPCVAGDLCEECPMYEGPSPVKRCYWPDELDGDCVRYWSSSEMSDFGYTAWMVGFEAAAVYHEGSGSPERVRCVR